MGVGGTPGIIRRWIAVSCAIQWQQMKPRADAGIFCIAILLSAFCTAQTRPAWIQNGDDAAIRALIEKMAAARNAHDGDAASATLPMTENTSVPLVLSRDASNSLSCGAP